VSRSGEAYILTQREPLPDEYLQQCEQDARCFSGAYTGTSGTLAAHVLRLLAEVRRLKVAAAYRENIEPGGGL
jgi:hypothetical protein